MAEEGGRSGKGPSKPQRETRKRKAAPKRRGDPRPAAAAAVRPKPGARGNHRERTKKKQFKRPAETSAGLAGLVTGLVSVLGLEGQQAKEVTAFLAAGVGLVPLAVSKLVDWKREKDEREAERLDLMERGILALEVMAGDLNGDAKIGDVLAVMMGESEPEEADGADTDE